MSETSCNFCYLSLLNTSLKGVSKIVENQFLKSCFELSLAIFITGCPEILQKHFRPIYQKRIGIINTDSHFFHFCVYQLGNDSDTGARRCNFCCNRLETTLILLSGVLQ